MPNQYAHYTRFASEFAANGYKAPDRRLTDGELHVIAIYNLLKDGEWHTASGVMQVTGSQSKTHTRNFLRSLMTPFNIASSQQGYCIINKKQARHCANCGIRLRADCTRPICKRCYRFSDEYKAIVNKIKRDKRNDK